MVKECTNCTYFKTINGIWYCAKNGGFKAATCPYYSKYGVVNTLSDIFGFNKNSQKGDTK